MKSSVRIRPWRASDLKRLSHLDGRLSRETLTARFWTGMHALPDSYVRSIGSRWPYDWDAVVAVRDGQLVGWAEFGRNAPGSADADAAFCVIDSEQGRGTGTALMRVLVERAATAGITRLHADIALDNTRALRAWQRATEGRATASTMGVDGHRGTITIQPVAARAA